MQTKAEYAVASQVPAGRRQEILRYLQLFGYKPDSTIVQVHVAGFFNKKGPAPKDGAKRAAAVKRYGGTTFVVVGRTHDPAILERLVKPRNPKQANPGYMGYLWMNKDPGKRPPHELIPLDFVPAQFHYPDDWKAMFATKGMLLAMHVPSSFASKKGELTRALYRLGKEGTNAKEEWRFLDELENKSYNYRHAAAAVA